VGIDMDSKQLLDQLLQAAKTAAEKGQTIAEDKLNIPESGEEREAALSGLKKGAAVAGVLALLLGTKSGRSVTSTAIKLGSMAALGTVAFKAYRNWKGGLITAEPNDSGSVINLQDEAAEQRSIFIFSAMVAAANADDHINQDEQEELKEQLLSMDLPESALVELKSIISNPPSVEDIIKQVDAETTATEVYLASRIFIHKHSSKQEQEYLQQLVDGMKLDSDLVVALDKELLG